MLEEKNCSLYRSQPLTILELQIVQPLGREGTAVSSLGFPLTTPSGQWWKCLG